MKVEIMNQFTQKWKVGSHINIDIFRTKRTLEQLKKDLDEDSYVTEGNWNDDGQVTVVYGNLADNKHGDINRVRTFAKGLSCDFGKRGYHTLEEILNSDLAYVKGYGLVEDKQDFEKQFKDAAQKK